MFYRNVEGMGDLLNIGHTVVVVVSGCGWLNIMDLYNDTDMDTMEGEIKYVDCQYTKLRHHTISYINVSCLFSDLFTLRGSPPT